MRKYADVNYDNNDLLACIDAVIHSKRDREMLALWLVDHYSQETIAEMFDMSVSQTKRNLRRDRERVFRKMRLI